MMDREPGQSKNGEEQSKLRLKQEYNTVELVSNTTDIVS